ncbi:hypothetical protein CHARACLAT_028903 [Characodon lateralis]|uniref:Uncharacterized protein n=1 Tax=Characodon lateralis TaxID=208331 RepID=A0ABU7DAY5_9TELE|nr:hypothetical protein [Characodon lateralis]
MNISHSLTHSSCSAQYNFLGDPQHVKKKVCFAVIKSYKSAASDTFTKILLMLVVNLKALDFVILTDCSKQSNIQDIFMHLVMYSRAGVPKLFHAMAPQRAIASGLAPPFVNPQTMLKIM